MEGVRLFHFFLCSFTYFVLAFCRFFLHTSFNSICFFPVAIFLTFNSFMELSFGHYEFFLLTLHLFHDCLELILYGTIIKSGGSGGFY